MSRIRFENSPSTNTPIIAENLDKLNNVVISPTQPTTGEEVWFKNGTDKEIYIKNNNSYEKFYSENDITGSKKIADNTTDNLNKYLKIFSINMTQEYQYKTVNVLFTLSSTQDSTYYSTFKLVAYKNNNATGITKVTFEEFNTPKELNILAPYMIAVANGSVLDVYYKVSHQHLTVNLKILELSRYTDNTTLQIYSEQYVTTEPSGTKYQCIKNEINPEIGSNTNGTYIKYPDGRLICYKEVTVTATIDKAWGSWFETTNYIEFGDFPITFISIPKVFVQTNGIACWAEGITGTTTTKVGKSYLARPVSTASGEYKFNIFAIGSWK